jgi:serine/threonine-protein kinase HipA
MINRCPITYEESGAERYSAKGLKRISPKLKFLNDFPYSADEQVKEAVARAAKMSIQGVQPKLSVKLNIKKQVFEIVDTGGHYIFKPQTISFDEVPENEDLTMHLAELAGINVPLHGLLYSNDGSLTYFIKRFDRYARNKKIHIEDFAQLSGKDRETKYNSSMEKVAFIIEEFCTFPAVENLKLFNLTLFNYLIGNEDMHLKNFSVIKRGVKVELSPAYDLLNSTIVLNSEEESALPLNGKKSRLHKDDFLIYFARERLGLTQKSIDQTIHRIVSAYPKWIEFINKSFLSAKMKNKYVSLLRTRYHLLGL